LADDLKSGAAKVAGVLLEAHLWSVCGGVPHVGGG
jgi:hypothetical protein